MGLIGFAHHGVFADDEHAAHGARYGAIDHFSGGEARNWVEGNAPMLLEFGLDVRGGDVLVGGEDARETAAVGAALHVVLAAQGVETGACFADVAAHEGEVGEGEGVVGAVGGLADAHAPVDGGAVGVGVEAGGLTDAVGGHTADLFGPFGGEGFQGFDVAFKVFGAVTDEAVVGESFFDDDVGHSLEDGDVGAGVLTQPEGGEVGHADLARVDDDEFGSVLAHRFFEEVGDDGVGFGGIGAGDDEGVEVFHFGDGIGHGAGADGELEAGDGTRVAEAGAVVDVVGVQEGAHEFLEDVGVFVGGFGAGVGGYRITAVRFDDAHEFIGDEVEGFVPGGFAPDGCGGASFLAVGADEGCFDAAGVFDVVGAEATFDA